MKIINRYTKVTIIERDVATIKELVELAVKEKINLTKANLSEANLSEANLIGANLNCIFYKTQITKKQKELICNSDLFEVIEVID